MAITQEQALDIARRRLAQEGGDALVIREESIVEREFGWVFYNTSRAYLETGDLNANIPGFGPLIVDRDTGATEFLSTSGPPDAGIELYEAAWRARRQT